MNTNIHLWLYLAWGIRLRNISDRSCRENQNIHFLFSNVFPRKSCHLRDSVEKYARARQATDYSYKHTLRMCNTNCFSTANMVTRTRLSVTLVCTLHLLSFRLFVMSCTWTTYRIAFYDAVSHVILSLVSETAFLIIKLMYLYMTSAFCQNRNNVASLVIFLTIFHTFLLCSSPANEQCSSLLYGLSVKMLALRGIQYSHNGN